MLLQSYEFVSFHCRPALGLLLGLLSGSEPRSSWSALGPTPSPADRSRPRHSKFCAGMDKKVALRNEATCMTQIYGIKPKHLYFTMDSETDRIRLENVRSVMLVVL